MRGRSLSGPRRAWNRIVPTWGHPPRAAPENRSIAREQLDEFAAASHEKAAAPQKNGAFDDEIITVDGHTRDEGIRPSTTVQRLAGLAPAFRTDELARRFPEITWSITAGNASPLTDGASAALVMSEERADALGLTPPGPASVHWPPSAATPC